MVLLSFDEPLTRIAEHLVLVMTNLFAAPQLALNQEHLLIGSEFQKLIRGNPSNNIREILGHAVIPDPEYLDDAGIVGQGIRLRAVNLQLPRILPEAPEREPPGPKQSCRCEQRVYAPKVPTSSQSISVRSWGRCLRCVKSRIKPVSHTRSNGR